MVVQRRLKVAISFEKLESVLYILLMSAEESSKWKLLNLYIKLFFMLFVFGFGKRKLLLPRRLCVKTSLVNVNSLFNVFAPMLLRVLNVVLAFVLTRCWFNVSQPSMLSTSSWSVSLGTFAIILAALLWSFCRRVD